MTHEWYRSTSPFQEVLESYVQPIADIGPWTCVVCNVREDTIVVDEWEGTHIWYRYGLRCEHQAHDTCYQRWSAEHDGMIGCPCCGELEKVKTNEFCMRCLMFGHSTCLAVTARTDE